VLLEYLNRGGVELARRYPMGVVKNAFDWGEPFVFGVPDGQDREFFRDVGLQLGETHKIGSPASVQRYAMHEDGRRYGAHLDVVLRQRGEAALKAMDDEGRRLVARAAATSGYWLAELTVAARTINLAPRFD
jgi:hypothetical protein